ncbi:hypothetical protein [Flavobacterium humidisoli]|uniref:Uncharacterized protein n=1 Tax=Flavobacterium humidisoli TaxID=2937442 RepID=A0ABY4LZH0_9FLAO|nr:hypothetical protein [Flavobacterium humidisoli]UPZ17943.1 hypothetical protein M0M44_11480 [Flavobacterium humidisoli]
MITKITRDSLTSLIIKGKKMHQNGKTKDTTIHVPTGLNLEKLFKDYDQAFSKVQNIEDTINDKQIKIFKDIWTVEYNTYFGLSTYYERESINIYNSDSTIQTFSDRFTDTRGDLYDLKLSFNHVATTDYGAFLMFRALADFGRASNFRDFDKRDFVYNNNPEVIGSGTMVEEKKKTGYYTEDGSPYAYGFLQKYSTELYASLKVIGHMQNLDTVKMKRKPRKKPCHLKLVL